MGCGFDCVTWTDMCFVYSDYSIENELKGWEKWDRKLLEGDDVLDKKSKNDGIRDWFKKYLFGCILFNRYWVIEFR